MPATPRRERRCGFTLIELLVVVAIIALLMSLLMTAVTRARKVARMTVCMNNMSVMGKTLETYASVFQDRVYTFSWTVKTSQSQWNELNSHGNDLIAAANQAVDILRRRADRPDIKKLGNWLPHIANTHLVLLDFLNARLPDPQVLCPEDRYRIAWSRDPLLHDKKMIVPYVSNGMYGAGTEFGKTWPYSASYNNVLCASERSTGGIFQATDILYYYYPNVIKMGGNKLADVSFPSLKVLTYDSISRHYASQPSYWGYADVQMPVTFFDASVRVKSVGSSNPGWNPTEPTSIAPLVYEYRPARNPPEGVWQPPPRAAKGGDDIIGRFVWTRGGLRGVDFGGGEISTGQPKP